jgi:hypothetical protein
MSIGTPDLGQVSPQDLLGLLQSVSQVSETGPPASEVYVPHPAG